MQNEEDNEVNITENTKEDLSNAESEESVQEENSVKEVREYNDPITYEKRGFRYGCYRFIKRIFDIIASGLGLILLSPILILAMFIKMCEDFHYPVYVSDRVGKNNRDGTRGKNFKFHKIRSMRIGADKEKADLIKQGKNEAKGPVFKMTKDPRVTRFGDFLRKSSIDELLQLWDIFRGKMSVVGPRPPIPEEVDEYTPHQMHRLDTKGGLLCLWQIQKNRNNIAFEKWVELDIEYIKKQSLWLDFKIIFIGFFMVIFDHSGH